MKIRVCDITAAGLVVRQEFDAAALDVERPDLNYYQPVAIEAQVHRDQELIVVRVMVRSAYHGLCARCLADVRVPVNKDVTIQLPAAAHREIDIADLAREELMLDYPPQLLCAAACKGLCPACGRNRNHQACACRVSGSSGTPLLS